MAPRQSQSHWWVEAGRIWLFGLTHEKPKCPRLLDPSDSSISGGTLADSLYVSRPKRPPLLITVTHLPARLTLVGWKDHCVITKDIMANRVHFEAKGLSPPSPRFIGKAQRPPRQKLPPPLSRVWLRNRLSRDPEKRPPSKVPGRRYDSTNAGNSASWLSPTGPSPRGVDSRLPSQSYNSMTSTSTVQEHPESSRATSSAGTYSRGRRDSTAPCRPAGYSSFERSSLDLSLPPESTDSPSAQDPLAHHQVSVPKETPAYRQWRLSRQS